MKEKLIIILAALLFIGGARAEASPQYKMYYGSYRTSIAYDEVQPTYSPLEQDGVAWRAMQNALNKCNIDEHTLECAFVKGSADCNLLVGAHRVGCEGTALVRGTLR